MEGGHQNSTPTNSSNSSSSDYFRSITSVPEEIKNPNEVNGFFKFAYEQKINENARLQEKMLVLQYENIRMKKANERQNNVDMIDNNSKKALENEIVCLTHANSKLEKTNKKNLEKISKFEKQQENGEPLIIYKLLHDGNKWHASINGYEKPVKLSITDSNNLAIYNIISDKKLVLDGVVSQYEDDPFKGNACGYGFNPLIISRLLIKVLSCYVSDLLLYHQDLTWKEYTNLTTSGMVKNLYFHSVQIKYENGTFVPLECVLEKVPNIEKFAFLFMNSIRDETFKNLVELPFFDALEEFKINYLCSPQNGYYFINFMKKHPNAHFTITLNNSAIAQYIKSHATLNKLEINEI